MGRECRIAYIAVVLKMLLVDCDPPFDNVTNEQNRGENERALFTFINRRYGLSGNMAFQRNNIPRL